MREEDPEVWFDAVAVDRAIRNGLRSLRGEVYLHRSDVLLDEADLSTASPFGLNIAGRAPPSASFAVSRCRGGKLEFPARLLAMLRVRGVTGERCSRLPLSEGAESTVRSTESSSAVVRREEEPASTAVSLLVVLQTVDDRHARVGILVRSMIGAPRHVLDVWV